MSFLRRLRFIAFSVRRANRIFNQFTDDKFESNRLLGEIIRNTHSIEKGLSLENVRHGFGYAKIKEAERFIKRFEFLNGTVDVEQVGMFTDALSAYIDFHRNVGYSSPEFEDIVRIHASLSEKVGNIGVPRGGIKHVRYVEYDNTVRETVARVISERHSVREFDKSPVSESDLREAISLAMRCPSACNRQCYRVTIINRDDLHLLDGWLDGVGGFAEQLDKMLIITGRISDYRLGEQFQYVVTPAVFAAYLTVTLQAYSIGCCFIQRNVLPDDRFPVIASKLGIPADEQAVCVLGIGNLKKEYKVPVSHRLTYDSIVRVYKAEK